MCDQQTPVSSEFLFSNKNQNKIMNYYQTSSFYKIIFLHYTDQSRHHIAITCHLAILFSDR